MCVKKRVLFLTFFFCISVSLFSQAGASDSARLLPEIEVFGQRSQAFAIGSSIEKVDTLALRTMPSKSLSDVLAAYSGVSIRSYGPGGLSAVSIRGSSTVHTAVLWNDINIASPMNGSLNLSVLPAFMIPNLSVQYGGSGTLYGSGAVTGVIHIDNAALFAQPDAVEIYSGFGSFGEKSMGASLKLGNRKVSSSIKLFTQVAINDFSFQNTAKFGFPVEKQTNAEVFQWGILQENTLKTSKKTFLKTGVWYQSYDKELQTLMTDTRPSTATQEDANLFVCANWKYMDSIFSFSAKAAYLFNQTIYKNPVTTEHAQSYANTAIVEAEGKYAISKRQLLDLNFNFTQETGYSDDYLGNPARNRESISASYRLMANRLLLVAGIRSEIVEQHFSPLIYSLGCDYEISKAVSVHGNFSKTYRIPTLNDLYWKTGMYTRGNPNLTPESGWSSQVGLNEKFGYRPIKFSFAQDVFYNLIYDQIVWFPNQVNGWMPENKKMGVSYGFENRMSMSANLGNTKFLLNTSYTRTYAYASENKESLSETQQLIYIPKNQVNVSIQWIWKKLAAQYTHNFYGKRHYDATNTLNAYQIGDFSVSYKQRIRQVEFTTSLRLANITNADYQVIAWYATPQRNWQLSLFFKFFTGTTHS